MFPKLFVCWLRYSSRCHIKISVCWGMTSFHWVNNLISLSQLKKSTFFQTADPPWPLGIILPLYTFTTFLLMFPKLCACWMRYSSRGHMKPNFLRCDQLSLSYWFIFLILIEETNIFSDSIFPPWYNITIVEFHNLPINFILRYLYFGWIIVHEDIWNPQFIEAWPVNFLVSRYFWDLATIIWEQGWKLWIMCREHARW